MDELQISEIHVISYDFVASTRTDVELIIIEQQQALHRGRHPIISTDIKKIIGFYTKIGNATISLNSILTSIRLDKFIEEEQMKEAPNNFSQGTFKMIDDINENLAVWKPRRLPGHRVQGRNNLLFFDN